MEVIHHGGKETVTGSCHELRSDGQAILIDCGMFQGSETRTLDIEFETQHISALLLTHSHIDHIGRLPWLLASGFHKPIYCSSATAEIAPLLLEDGLKLQGLNHQQTKHILSKIQSLIEPQPYGKWFPIGKIDKGSGSQVTPTRKGKQEKDHHRPNTLYARFQPAGHILGSAYIEVRLPNQEIVVFSGDLGPSNTPLLPDPVPPERADYLFIETTYGNRTHDDVDLRARKLKSIIDHSLMDGGTILIPAFSVGRTQELLFDMEQLIYSHQITSYIPIILDSPMAQKVTASYRKFKHLWGQEAKKALNMHRHPLAFEQCITIDSHTEHQRLVNRLQATHEPAIVVAASGMCQGGRIMEYLKALLPDTRTDIIFAGYQAEGTLGRELQQRKDRVWIDGQSISVKAQVHTMSGYSAHADQSDLLKFIEGIERKPKQIHLIHGEKGSQKSFARILENKGYRLASNESSVLRYLVKE